MALNTTSNDSTLFLDELFSDVTFVLKYPDGAEKSVPAHRSILANASKVFHEMFCATPTKTTNTDEESMEQIESFLNHGCAKESKAETNLPVDQHEELVNHSSTMQNKTEISLPGDDHEGFVNVLRFIYTGSVSLSDENIIDTLRVAQKYDVTALEQLCENKLMGEIKAENVSQALHLANKYNLPKLKERVFEQLKKTATKFFASDDFLNLSRDALKEIIALDSLEVEELDVFKALMRWAKKHLGDVVSDNVVDHQYVLRENLDDIIQLIQFHGIHFTDFADVVAPTGILTYPELVSMVRYYGEFNRDTPVTST